MHVACDLLDKDIIVYDDRARAEHLPGVLFHYQQGYKPQVVIKKKMATQLLASPGVLWIHLTPGHFTALSCSK